MADTHSTSTPLTGLKRDQPSPDDISPSLLQAEKQQRLDSGDSSFSLPPVPGSQTDTVVQISDIVCATLKNPDVMNSLIPLIAKRVVDEIGPSVRSFVNKEVTAAIEKRVDPKLESLERKLNEQTELIKKQQLKITSLQTTIMMHSTRIEAQEQYSRRTSLRFNNIRPPALPNGTVKQPIDTDALVLNVCNNMLNLQDITLDDIGRTHPIGEEVDGKISIIVRFNSYRKRQLVFGNKKLLKDNPDNTYITENLTKQRYTILRELSFLRKKQKIQSYWTYDGTILVKINDKNKIWKITPGQGLKRLFEFLNEQPPAENTEEQTETEGATGYT